MTVTEEQARAAFIATLAKARQSVIQAWTVEQFPLVRERLWNEHQAIDRIEEAIQHDFAGIIRRAAGAE